MNDTIPPVIRRYCFRWKDGTLKEGVGYGDGAAGAADALTRLGYGNGAVAALDYWYVVGRVAPTPEEPGGPA